MPLQILMKSAAPEIRKPEVLLLSQSQIMKIKKQTQIEKETYKVKKIRQIVMKKEDGTKEKNIQIFSTIIIKRSFF